MALGSSEHDDPRKLRQLLSRAAELAQDHDVSSVVIGMWTLRSDMLFPEIVDFVASALRMEDSIFRMTRDRAVLVLSDADRARAEEVIQRVLSDFTARFATTEDPDVHLGYFEVRPGAAEISVKDVLPKLFGAEH